MESIPGTKQTHDCTFFANGDNLLVMILGRHAVDLSVMRPPEIMSKIHNPLLIVVHDVATPFVDELRTIFAQLPDLVGSRFAAAVVPGWHGTFLNAADEIVDLAAQCDEIMLHGHTHFRCDNPGIISKLTNRSDELRGLTKAAIQERIDLGRDQLVSITGADVAGFLPPAWQLPVPAVDLQRLAYVMRFGKLESCDVEQERRRLATWSYDWGRIKQAAHAGDLLGRFQLMARADAIPCIAIHPIDVSRGWLPHIMKLIRRLLNRGYQPTVPGEFMTGSTERAKRFYT